jgi:hypothetical protein
MKNDGIWSPKMKAIYPMVGASAAACAQNLKSSSFTGTFTSGWTFASTGVTPNGTSAYMDTGLNQSVEFSQTNGEIGVYSRTDSLASVADIGCYSSLRDYCLFAKINVGGAKMYGRAATQDVNSLYNPTTSLGLFSIQEDGTNTQKFYRNGVLRSTKTVTTNTLANINIYLGAANSLTVPSLYSGRQYALAYASNTLTATNQANLYTAVQTFQTTLNRNVGPQVVSDADAQAYINRVYNAGGTLTDTEANAVNQLTIDMKAAGIWTKMKAIYPMVGASAAACAQDLKSSSFTGAFSSGITYSSNGVLGNGTSGFMNTGLNSNSDLILSNNHLSYYSRSSTTTGVTVEMGVFDPTFNHLRIAVNHVAGGLSTITNFTTNLTSLGFWIGSKTSSTLRKTYRNGLLENTNTNNDSNSYPSLNVFLLARNDAGVASYFSDRECAFASIGDGLTDTEASDFYTAVQTFNTTLSRQV